MGDQQADEAAFPALIEARVAAYCARHSLLPERGLVVVAVSGGADSLCLLGVLASLAGESGRWPGLGLIVAHLDHGLRGAEAAADARFVQHVAEELGLPFRMERRDVAALARTTRHGIEDAARRARYTFLHAVAAELGAVRICTGHTHDDQVETLVMRWLRGSGLTGLSGMRALAGDVARPLLCVTREETHRYCAARGWAWREDSTNTDPRFWRNRIRRDVLPVLLRENPNLRATLTRTAETLARDDAFIQQAAERAWATCVRSADDESVVLERGELAAVDPALQSRVVRRAAERLHSGEPVLDWTHVDAVLALVRRGAVRRRLAVPGGLTVRLERDALVVAREPPGRVNGETESARSAAELPLPGCADVPGTRWRICAELLDALAGGLPPGTELSSYGADYVGRDMLWPATGTAELVGRAQMRAYLDADAVRLPLHVRTWRPGDRFRPLGMAGEKKLQDFFVDARIPRAERGRIPLVFDAQHLLWVGGHRLDNRVRVRPETRRVLALRLEHTV